MTFYEVLYGFFEDPWILLVFLPFLLLLLVFMGYQFIRLQDEAPELKLFRQRKRRLVTLVRVVFYFLLFVALAGPFVERQELVHGDPRVHILVDNSSSFSLFDQSFFHGMVTSLQEHVPVEISEIAYGDHSPLGDGVLRHVKQGDTLLLVTDGHVTEGVSLGDVVLHAASLNTTISALALRPSSYDVAIRIVGPMKTIAHVDTTYKIVLDQSVDARDLPVTVTVDGSVVSSSVFSDSLIIQQSFSSGYHEIEARVIVSDTFSENNVYRLVTKVVPKPHVLLVSPETSPLEELFSPIFHLDVSSVLKGDISSYTAIIFNDVPESQISDLDTLTDFVTSGNGLIVVGGISSYDVGDYKNSAFERMLPVYVAQAGKKRGNSNIVVVLDISGSTGSLFGGDKSVDVEKALALQVMQDIGLVNKVGVVAFNTQSFEVAPLKLLLEHKEDVFDKISRLTDKGGTKVDQGVLYALQMLQQAPGDKNIILITDGKTQGYDEALSVAREAARQGVKLYTVGIGKGTHDQLLQLMADLGNGAYFKPEERQGLNVLFGDLDDDLIPQKDYYGIVMVNKHHFITSDLDITATILGYNTVVPKSTAQLLLTTDLGDPLLSTWRFGLGRVASVMTDDGRLYAGSLLGKENSLLWTRIVNFGVGDPERKNDYYVMIPPARAGDFVTVEVKSDLPIVSDSLEFSKIDDSLYSATLYTPSVGFYSVLGARYAVNYPREYERVGFNTELETFVRATGGTLFEPSEIEDMVKFVIAHSKRFELQRVSYRWVFAVLALFIFISEIAFRRLWKFTKKS